jgi:hypothetical protein
VQPAINIYDLKKALKTVTKEDPVHSEFDLRRSVVRQGQGPIVDE